MHRYAFIWDDEMAFVVRAKSKRNAVRVFKKKVEGRFGFFKKLTLADVLCDISNMSIVVRRVTEV